LELEAVKLIKKLGCEIEQRAYKLTPLPAADSYITCSRNLEPQTRAKIHVQS